MLFPFWPDPKNSHLIELGLSRVEEGLHRLGNPHLKLPPTIHIAGTNGKGSVLAFLKGIFEAAGLKVHRYISPHLVEFNERIEVAGKPISDDFLNQVLNTTKAACEQEPKIFPTFFEGTTLAAFLAFSKVPADILLLETGMGGEFDATNILPEILCSIITPISFDHQEFLGGSLSEIAKAKAGIIKPNCLAISAIQVEEVKKVLINQALKNKAKLAFIDDEILQTLALKRFSKNLDLSKLELSMLGNYQQQNAKLAIACAIAQNYIKIEIEQIFQGIKQAFWPARLQKIDSGKLHSIVNSELELILDGSHNLEGAKNLHQFLQDRRKSAKNKNAKAVVIFSMLTDKDCRAFLKEISEEIGELIVVSIENQPRAMKAEEIAEIAKSLKIKVKCAANLANALKIANQIQNQPLIVITGSLYLAGEFLKQNFS